MKRAWKKIERLIAQNAEHRKGFRLASVQREFVLLQAGEEFQELVESPDDPYEMADLLGVLIHYAIKQGWTMEFLESLLIEKLGKRFTVASELEDKGNETK